MTNINDLKRQVAILTQKIELEEAKEAELGRLRRIEGQKKMEKGETYVKNTIVEVQEEIRKEMKNRDLSNFDLAAYMGWDSGKIGNFFSDSPNDVTFPELLKVHWFVVARFEEE